MYRIVKHYPGLEIPVGVALIKYNPIFGFSYYSDAENKQKLRKELVENNPEFFLLPDTTQQTKFSRIEVIDHSINGLGRVFHKLGKALSVELSNQDEGRTLKIFISEKKLS